MFPIKYIDNNLVWNKDNEVFAYYELIPYNYSFLSPEQKYLVHDSFRQLIAQSREGKIHALQIATESSIRSIQEQSKKLVTGKLREVAIQKIDDQTEALVSMIGDNQVDYRFFLGFKLMVTEDEVNLKNIKKSVFLTFREFLNEVRHTLMNDFVSMSNDEINRYVKMEKLLENKISRRFKIRRLEAKDFAYLMEHLYGDKLPADKKSAIEGALAKLKEAHKNADVAAIDTAIAELNAAWQAASQDIYAQQQAQGAQPGADAGQQSQANAGNASNGDSSQPEDVEFEEVK